MNIQSLHRIERLNYVLGALLVIVMAFVLSRPAALGVLVGALLSCLNFTVMRGMVQSWLRRAPEKRGVRSYFMVPKMGALMLAVFLAIQFLPITAEGLVIGFSVFLLSIAVETVRYISSPPDSKTAEPGADEAKK